MGLLALSRHVLLKQKKFILLRPIRILLQAAGLNRIAEKQRSFFFTDKVEMRCADQKLRSSVLLLQNQATSWDVAGGESDLR